MTKEQLASYGTSVATGGTSFVVQLNQWTAMEWLTATGMLFGIVGVIVRAYCDIAAHIDRRRQLEEGEDS